MNSRDSRDDHLFCGAPFWFSSLCCCPPSMSCMRTMVNRPLLALAEAQIQVFAPFFEEAQTAWARIADAVGLPVLGKHVEGVALHRFVDSLALCPLLLVLFRRGGHLHGPRGWSCPAFQPWKAC